MKSTYRHAFVLALLICAATTHSHAQNGVNSPYSRYGFGMMADRAMGFNKAMGGVAQGFRDGQIINAANPASYSAVDSLTALFDMGMSVYNGNYKMGTMQQNAKNASFDYMAFQFRALRGVGVSLGILPYTNISYDFKSTTENLVGTDIPSGYTFNGDGGLHQVYLGVGARVFRGLSAGVNGSYLYGDYTHNTTMSLNQSGAYSMMRTYKAHIATYKLDFGLQYELPLTRKLRLTVGATYGLGHDVTNRAFRQTQTLEQSSMSVTARGITTDTIHDAFQLPHTFAAGFSLAHTDKWAVGADFDYEKWGSARFPNQSADASTDFVSTTGQLHNRWKVSLGGMYTPKSTARSYLKRMTYKAGAYYSHSYAKTAPTSRLSDQPTEYGLSAGFALPVSNRNTWHNVPKINIAFQWVHSNIPYLSSNGGARNTLTENYLRLSVGVTFSERWFFKWKVQ